MNFLLPSREKASTKLTVEGSHRPARAQRNEAEKSWKTPHPVLRATFSREGRRKLARRRRRLPGL
jgi:hypothetical protein